MNRAILIVMVCLFLLVALFGAYLTLVAYDKKMMDSKNLSNKVFDDHVKLLKVLGPIIIGVGVLGVLSICFVLGRK